MVEEQLRLRGNSSQLRQLFTDAGIQYEVIKNLSVSGNYRYIIKPFRIDQRLYTDISYSWKKKNFKITPRIRLQHEFVKNNIANNYIRPKIEFEYKVTKTFKPFISGELFYHALYYKGSVFDEYRLSAGASYDFNKKNSLKLFYLQQQQFNVNAAQQNHVLGVGYEYDL